ncbi:hypothetical protein P8625_10010 [Tenacibaculum tangerinum]|uniref:Uncharacterized protein n=1 Tax=Tenacibaculum tangerinum TaxID=3038772 RepID=A0ABY8KZG0_9FLAO|nr:hypothetical protein [Tenacibaculum tangerinum]WGH74440.1 hypothetical protein P8625_10010 [Tenacibaculum tangerinum]
MTFFNKKTENSDKHKKTLRVDSPEVGSAIVRIAHKLSASNSKGQVVKIGDKYFRMKELG